MSLAGKIAVAALVALALFVFWPRNPSLNHFDPDAVAKGELTMWQALRDGRTGDAGGAWYAVLTKQFGFGPVAAWRLSDTEAKAIAGIFEHINNPQEQDALQPEFVEAATMFFREVKAERDTAAVGRASFFLWTQVADGHRAEKLMLPAVKFVTLWSGLSENEVRHAGELRAQALAEIFGKEGNADPEKAAAHLAASWKRLAEALGNTTATPAQAATASPEKP